jgi:hypothetical protein
MGRLLREPARFFGLTTAYTFCSDDSSLFQFPALTVASPLLANTLPLFAAFLYSDSADYAEESDNVLRQAWLRPFGRGAPFIGNSPRCVEDS